MCCVGDTCTHGKDVYTYTNITQNTFIVSIYQLLKLKTSICKLFTTDAKKLVKFIIVKYNNILFTYLIFFFKAIFFKRSFSTFKVQTDKYNFR